MNSKTRKGPAVKPGKRYGDMSLDELREATKAYDAPDPDPIDLPMPPALKAKHDRLVAGIREQITARKAGRPVVGQGAERVLISIERGLLSEADAFAKRHGKSRSELIAEGLRRVMKTRTPGKPRKSA